jgi:hypothetical protein
VWPLAGIVASPLGKLRDGDARLEPVRKVRPRVRIDHRVAGLDLEDVRARAVECAEPNRLLIRLDDVCAATGRGTGAAIPQCRARGEKTRGRYRGQETENAPGAHQTPARDAVGRRIRLQRVLVQLVHVLESVPRGPCQRRVDRIRLDHVLTTAVVTTSEQAATRLKSLALVVAHVGVSSSLAHLVDCAADPSPAFIL